MKKLLSILLSLALLLVMLPVGIFAVPVAAAEEVDLEEVDLEEVFQSNLNFLDQYYTLGPEFIAHKLCGILYDWEKAEANNYADQPMPAAEFEEVLYRYFDPAVDLLTDLRSYQLYEWETNSYYPFYNAETGMYNIFFVGGFGGDMPIRQYLGYMTTETGYTVFYQHITYDYLPDTPEIRQELEALDWPFTYVYNGEEYENGPDGYTRVASLDDYGNKYEVQYNNGILRILSQTPYTAAPESDFEYEIIDGEAKITRYVGDSTEVIIPAQLGGCPVTVLGGSMFNGYHLKLKSVIVPDSVRIMEKYVFHYCEELRSVILGNGIEVIEGFTFSETYCLSSIVIPDSVTTIKDGAFNCSALSEITFGSGLTTIESEAFSWCNLKTVIIPDNVVTIGDGAFNNNSLRSAHIGSGVTHMGDSVFDGCYLMESITVDEDNPSYCAEDGVLFNKDKTVLMQYPMSKPEKTYAIPDTVTAIERKALFTTLYLAELYIPAGVVSIGDYALAGGDCMEAFVVAEDNPSYCAVDGVLLDKQQAVLLSYPATKTAASYKIPDTVTTIVTYAFAWCGSLTAVTIPKSVLTVASSAFHACSALEHIYYAGSEEDRAAMDIENEYGWNDYLVNATWHYNWTGANPGDANGDGKVNVRDLGLLQQHLNGWDVTLEEIACDVNADGKVNVRDLGLLQQHLNGWDVELKLPA